MAEIQAGGLNFHIQRLSPGDEPTHATVVFLHGPVLDNLTSFYFTIAWPIVRSGVEGILYDQRGHGKSARPATGYSLSDGVADLAAILHALELGRKVFLLGNSYGGVLATHMALAHPELVEGLILIEGYAGEGAAGWTEDIANWLTVVAMQLQHDQIPQKLASAGQAKPSRTAGKIDLLLNGTSLINDLASEEQLEPSELKRLSCPVLAIYGSNSRLVGAAELIRENVSNARVEIIPGFAHSVMFDAGEQVSNMVNEWIRDVGI
jgi:pimeloyl-ACP methyl ester carboxylesterase